MATSRQKLQLLKTLYQNPSMEELKEDFLQSIKFKISKATQQFVKIFEEHLEHMSILRLNRWGGGVDVFIRLHMAEKPVENITSVNLLYAANLVSYSNVWRVQNPGLDLMVALTLMSTKVPTKNRIYDEDTIRKAVIDYIERPEIGDLYSRTGQPDPWVYEYILTNRFDYDPLWNYQTIQKDVIPRYVLNKTCYQITLESPVCQNKHNISTWWQGDRPFEVSDLFSINTQRDLRAYFFNRILHTGFKISEINYLDITEDMRRMQYREAILEIFEITPTTQEIAEKVIELSKRHLK